ncbi:MAG TPA: DNA translocase FtsK 4TM domain-containing protein [Thermoanaerobaculia bacterium]|nr:DNA translocase FtsK 4TM domain-containing protein [Thermoanaerobaculia bacterium]
MELSSFFRSRRGGELVGIVVLALGVIVAIALLTYHPDDSSAFFTASDGTTDNAIGYWGATLAWILVSFLGFGALLFPATLLAVGWNRFWGREVEYVHTKLLGFLVLVTALPPTLDLTIGRVWLRDSLVPAGGYLGSEINVAIAANLNRPGTAIVLVTAILVGLLLATRISLGGVFLTLREITLRLAQTLSLQWARLRERHRKEKMKTEVIRKHLERAEAKVAGTAAAGADAEESEGSEADLVVREVKGHGRFQIRKVTKADLRKVAEELAEEKKRGGRVFSSPFEEDEEFEDLPVPLRRAAPPSGGRSRERVIPKPQSRRPKDAPRRADAVAVRGGGASTERLPFVGLLTPASRESTIDEAAHKRYLELGKLIEDRCREFAVEGEVTAYHPGPVVTTFEFKPGTSVKYAKVVNLGDDLALALRADSVRIERISGSSTVGIEVPNRKREIILLREIVDSEEFVASSSLMTLALGKDIHGAAVVTDLARMPHLLVAGATGAGKSVGLNSMIVSLLYKALPRQLKLLMIDPKMVELKIYEDIPHLLHPIVTDPKLASNALLWTVQEMENRYRLLASCGVRNIDQYNALLKDPEALRRLRRNDEELPELNPMHFIVVIIDEFADLMMIAPKDVEDSVTRLAQKARAVGIHLILATQRPSVDVITGVIKANLPSRISYQVASKVDSRTILDAQGAEKLLGSGDMLFLPPGTARIRRIHGAYISEKEIAEIVDFVKKNQGRPEYVEEVTRAQDEKTGAGAIDGLEDLKYDDAVRVVLSTGQASASYLQRRLKLGYSRAARLIELMEAHGIVGPSQGSKPREILISPEDYPGMDDAASL